MKDNHARFMIVWAESDAATLTIRDVGPWTNHPTITNDAEYVIEYLYNMRVLINERRVMYYDSEGALGELLHDGATFKGFRTAWPSKGMTI